MRSRRTVRRLISEADARRSEMKKGRVTRFYTNLKKAFAVMTMVAMAQIGIGEVCANSYVTRKAGTSRADILEIYGGDANT